MSTRTWPLPRSASLYVRPSREGTRRNGKLRSESEEKHDFLPARGRKKKTTAAAAADWSRKGECALCLAAGAAPGEQKSETIRVIVIIGPILRRSWVKGAEIGAEFVVLGGPSPGTAPGSGGGIQTAGS